MKEEKDNMDSKQKEGIEALNKALEKRVDSVEPDSITPSLENEIQIPEIKPKK